jgi:hypothetical protein
MLKAGVTIACSAALVAAALLTVWLRDTQRTPSPLSGSEPLRERLGVTVGRTGGMLMGAYLAGVLTIGAGSRLMMRILAATSADDVQGLRTEADETVGAVSGGGSFFLVVVVGVGVALVGLGLFSLLRHWLPTRSLAAGLVGVAIGAGVLVRPLGLLTSANTDFALVAPASLAVAFCITTLVLFGTTFAVLVDRLAPRWPRPGWNARGLVAVLPFAILLPAPPLLLGVGVGVVVGAVAPTMRSRRSQRDRTRPEIAGTKPDLGRIVVMTLGGLGGLSVVLAAGEVLIV